MRRNKETKSKLIEEKAKKKLQELEAEVDNIRRSWGAIIQAGSDTPQEDSVIEDAEGRWEVALYEKGRSSYRGGMQSKGRELPHISQGCSGYELDVDDHSEGGKKEDNNTDKTSVDWLYIK